MKIIKFGGSNFKSKNDIDNSIDFIINQTLNDENIVIIISAFDKLTSILRDTIYNIINNSNSINHEFNKIKFFIEKYAEINHPIISKRLEELEQLLLAISILEECSPKVKDNIISIGDLISSEIFYLQLNSKISASFINSREIFQTNSNFGNARINIEKTQINIKNNINTGVNVIAGFIGSDEFSNPTTLGLENSNLSALLCSIALDTKECEYITDTEGIFEVDPKLIASSNINNISYIDAMKLAKFGLKLFTIEQLDLANKYNIKLIYYSLSDLESKTAINENISSFNYIIIKRDKDILIFVRKIDNILLKLNNIKHEDINEIYINLKDSFIKILTENNSKEFINYLYKELYS